MSKNDKKIKMPIICIKIVFFTILFLALSFGALIYFVNYSFTSESQFGEKEHSISMNAQNAAILEHEFNTIRSEAFLLLDTLNINEINRSIYDQNQTAFFQRHSNIISIVVSDSKKLYNNNYFFANDFDTTIIDRFVEQNQEEITAAENGETFILNAAPLFKKPVLALLCPWKENGLNQAAIILFSSEDIYRLFSGSDKYLSYAVNNKGDLIIHPDFSMIKSGANLENTISVEKMRKDPTETNQIEFTDSDMRDLISSYSKVSVGDCGVITTYDKENSVAPIQNSLKSLIYLSGAIFFFVVLLMWLVAFTIRLRVKKLWREATNRGKTEESPETNS